MISSSLFKNKQLLLLAKSLATSVFVSCLFGVASVGLDKPFWPSFSYSLAVQFILGYVVATIAQSYYKNNTYIAELNALEKLSTILNCAYCNHPSVVTFLPDEVPNIVCEKCKNTSSIKLQFSVARTTIPATPNATNAILKEPQQANKINL